MIDVPDNRTADTGHGRKVATVLSAREAADSLGLHERTIRRAIARGDLRAAKRAGTFVITRDDLDRFRESRATASPPAPGTDPDVRLRIRTVPADASFLKHTHLFGRERDQAAIQSLLTEERVRLLTLTGPGGVGKTQLALAVAAAIFDSYGDGAWFVDLTPLVQANLVPDAVARGLGMRNAAEGLETNLKQRNLLLVLDNFERVLPAAPAIADLIAACPGVQILATSRIPLHLYEERLFPVQPLPTLAADRALPVATLGSLPSVRLFAARARAVMPGFVLTDDNAVAVAGICHRLDGLPLAIELAAARSAVLSPQALLARLDPRLPLLTGGASDLPHRLRTMRDTIAWSYDLLDHTGQRLFRQVSVFAGGFSLEAATAVCGSPTGSSIGMLDDLSALVSQSLLRQTAPGDAEPRFSMLETVREFGMEQLLLHDEQAEAAHRHAAWALAFAEDIVSNLDGRDDRPKLDRFEAERDNCRAAVAWLLDAGDVESAMRLCSAQLELWYHRGPVGEGRAWLRRALAATGNSLVSPDVRSRALQVAGQLAFMQGDLVEADSLALASLELARASGNLRAQAWACNWRGVAAIAKGNSGEARSHLDLALDLLPAGHPGLLTMLLFNRAAVAESPDRARRYLGDALAICRERGERGSNVVLILNRLGNLALREDQHAEAYRCFMYSLDLCWEVRDFWSLPQSLAGLAKVHEALGSSGAAGFLRDTANAVRDRMGLSTALDRAGGQAFGPVADQMDALEERIVTARSLPIELPPDAAPSQIEHDSLTPREREVLALIVEGRSNRAIAGTLSVSERTVDSHVFHILTKLRLESRSAAAVWAVRNGLA
jgi:excisionase family DNA binding protein